jgi:ATP-dependent Clp protease ATP-binding subunit ClpC
VVQALQQVKGVLVLTDTIDALKAGGSGAEDLVASYLGTYLGKGQLRILGEITPRALEAAKGMLPAFVHNFEILPIRELDLPTTTAVMKRFRIYAANNYAIETGPDALDVAIALVNRYIKYQRNPGKRVQFFTRVIRQAHHEKRQQIDAPFVLQQFIQYTALPPILLDDARPLPKASLLDYYRQRIKGQGASDGVGSS